MTETILRLPEVKARTKLGRSTIYDAMQRGDFPQPMKLGLRAVGWIEAEVDAWVEARKAQRKAA